MIRKLIKKTFGKRKYQSFYERLFSLSLCGMNYGNGHNFLYSGELCVLNLIKNYYRVRNTGEQLILFDVGAHTGGYIESILKCFEGVNIRIFGFEPTKINYQKLKDRCQGLNEIAIYNFGFGNRKEYVSMHVSDKHSRVGSIYERDKRLHNFEFNRVEEIELRTIDEFCSENDISKIHFIKIDVEGHELKVLEGAQNIIRRSVDFIQFEFGVTNVDSRTYLFDFIKLLGAEFDLYRIVRDGIYPLKYTPEMEIFQVINFLAVHKSAGPLLST